MHPNPTTWTRTYVRPSADQARTYTKSHDGYLQSDASWLAQEAVHQLHVAAGAFPTAQPAQAPT